MTSTRTTERRRIPILMANDDPDDRMLVKDALDEVRLANDVFCLHDGVELLGDDR